MTSLSAAVPTISLSLKGRALSEAILDACTGTGFFYLTDIPIESRLIDTAWKASEQLFLDRSEAAMEQKMKTRSRETNTGYTALLEEKLDPEGDVAGAAASSSSSSDAKHDGKAEEEDGLLKKKSTALPGGDMKESFYIARLKETEKETRLQTLPPLFDEYNDDLTELFEACKETTTTVMRAFAVALGLPEEYFASQHHAIDDRLRLIHYPPITSQDEGKGYIRAGSHSDYGTITLLFQRGVSGLQVQVDSADDGKQWIDVEPKKNAIVVNVGDALEFWTAGAFRSTQHRVVMPRNEGEAVSRFSIAYFCQPDPDAMLDPLSNINAIKPFPPREEKDFQEVLRRKGIDSSVQRLTGGQHLHQRLSSTYVN